jgi:hypothetical protein
VNEPSSLKRRDKLDGRLALTGCFLFFPLLFLACAFSEPKPIPAATDDNFSELLRSVVQTRGLALKQNISLASDSGQPAAVAPHQIYSGAPIAQIEQAYKSVGLLPRSSDFTKELSEFRALQRLTTYDAAKSTVSWAPHTSRVAAALMKTDAESARDLAPVFAIVHALQEQHFRWRAVIDNVAPEDRRSAFRAVAAGDALLTLTARTMQKNDPQFAAAARKIGAQAAIEMERLANSLPVFLRRQLSFPYRAGSEFVYWAFRTRGWQGVNLLYANPPLSTAEILHPEKYFIKGEAPLRFFPPHLLHRFKTTAVEQSLGEDTIVGLLAREQSQKMATEIGAAWRGDQLFAFPEQAGLTAVWFSSWETEAEAERFLHAYRAVLQAELGIRFQVQAGADNATTMIARRDSRGWLLQRSAAVVLLVSASGSSRLLEIAADAWRDLEIDKEAPEVRFESAQARLNSR